MQQDDSNFEIEQEPAKGWFEVQNYIVRNPLIPDDVLGFYLYLKSHDPRYASTITNKIICSHRGYYDNKKVNTMLEKLEKYGMVQITYKNTIKCPKTGKIKTKIGRLVKVKNYENVNKFLTKGTVKTDYPTLVKTDYPTLVKTDYPTLVKTDYPTLVKTDYPTLVKTDYHRRLEENTNEKTRGEDQKPDPQASSPSAQMGSSSHSESESSHLISSVIEKVKTDKTRLSLTDHKQLADERRSEALDAQEALLNSQGYDKSQTKRYREEVLKEYTKKLHFLDPLFPKYTGDLEDCLEAFKGKVQPNWYRCTKCSGKWLKRGEKLCSDCKNEEVEKLKAKQAKEEAKKAQELGERKALEKAQDEQVSKKLKDFGNQQAFKSWLSTQGYAEYAYDLAPARRMWIESLQEGSL